VTWHVVADASTLKNEDAVAVKVAGLDIALCMLDSQFFAIGNICTHQHAYLTEGYVENGCIECPLHQGRFEIRTGKAMGAPVSEPVPTYPTRLENGQVLIFVA
jgi:nitrite reductase/ring-hydroxylating ferredoxin subunit